jgi:GTP-binding protein YchF
MQIGLLGLPQSGKKTLLRLLTTVDASVLAGNGAVPGVCQVRDPRVDKLTELYRPAKVTRATIQYLLLPDLTKDSAKNQELFNAILQVDVLAAVIRAFADDTVFHLDGSVDPGRDLDLILSELLLHDLIFIEKRLERIEKESKGRGGADRSREAALLTRLQEPLNQNVPLRAVTLNADEQKLLSGTPLLSRKPLLVILNVGEGEVRDRRPADAIAQRAAGQRVHVVQVSAKIEEELAALDPAERPAFLTELGIAEPAIDGLTRVSYEALGLISYFTVGTDEVRAWTVRRGAAAPEAGRVIHSDIERGFIRAELMKYEDLIRLGSEQAVAGAGKAYLKGKEYMVEDGDILSFRFSV